MNRSFWHQWAQSLQRYHLRGLSLVLLEGTGPLKIVLAQFMLAGIPFASSVSKARWEAAAEMLEDRDESRTFAAFLREESVN
jgi:hypothetical protein